MNACTWWINVEYLEFHFCKTTDIQYTLDGHVLHTMFDITTIVEEVLGMCGEYDHFLKVIILFPSIKYIVDADEVKQKIYCITFNIIKTFNAM